MKRFQSCAIALLVLAGLTGCASTNETSIFSTNEVGNKPVVASIRYESAQDELGLVPSTVENRLHTLSNSTGVTHLLGPYLSVARKCNSDRTVCKQGVVQIGLRFSEKKMGNDWIIEGDMTAALERSATVTLGNTTTSISIPNEVALIDDKPLQSQHFRWIVKSGSPLKLQGPGGSSIYMEKREE